VVAEDGYGVGGAEADDVDSADRFREAYGVVDEDDEAGVGAGQAVGQRAEVVGGDVRGGRAVHEVAVAGGVDVLGELARRGGFHGHDDAAALFGEQVQRGGAPPGPRRAGQDDDPARGEEPARGGVAGRRHEQRADQLQLGGADAARADAHQARRIRVRTGRTPRVGVRTGQTRRVGVRAGRAPRVGVRGGRGGRSSGGVLAVVVHEFEGHGGGFSRTG
jgi:hypothetical protein